MGLQIKKTAIRKNTLLSIYKFSLQCILPGQSQLYKAKKWSSMNGEILNNANIRAAPYITFDVCLKTNLFDEWWSKLKIYHPPFAADTFVELDQTQFNMFNNGLN